METTHNELLKIAQAIRERQRATGASDNAWVRKYPGLGSTKTYAKLIAGDTASLDPDRWIVDYRAVESLLDALEGGEQEEPLYDDLTPVVALRAALSGAMREESNRRLVLVVGEPGMGKTTAARMVAGRYGARVILAEADELWKESPAAMLGGLLRALGVREFPASGEARKVLLLERLRTTRTCLVIDEAHHLGPRTLNLVKTILNQTPGEIVFLCLPTLWRNLATQAYHEARQLTANRLYERIALDGVSKADAARFIERRVPGIDGAAAQAGELARQDSNNRGGLAWIAAVCGQVRRLSGGEGGCDVETFARGLARAAQLRGVA